MVCFNGNIKKIINILYQLSKLVGHGKSFYLNKKAEHQSSVRIVCMSTSVYV